MKNLEQISELERELEIARLYSQEQVKKNLAKEVVGIYNSNTAKMNQPMSPVQKNDSVLKLRDSLMEAPKVET